MTKEDQIFAVILAAAMIVIVYIAANIVVTTNDFVKAGLAANEANLELLESLKEYYVERDSAFPAAEQTIESGESKVVNPCDLGFDMYAADGHVWFCNKMNVVE